MYVSECTGLRLLHQHGAGAGVLACVQQDCVALAADEAVVSQWSASQTVGWIRSAWMSSLIHSSSPEMAPFGKCIF